MSDKIKGFHVSLDRDISTEEAHEIMNAIKMIKHVQSVGTSVVSGDDWTNRQRIKSELFSSISDILYPEFKK
jgi:hypothetical protein